MAFPPSNPSDLSHNLAQPMHGTPGTSDMPSGQVATPTLKESVDSVKTQRAHQKTHTVLLVLGWIGVLIFCLAIYNTLVFHSLQRTIRDNSLSSAIMVASQISMKLNTGLRFGKQLDNYYGLQGVVDNAAAAFTSYEGMAVLLADGSSVYSLGAVPRREGGETRANGVVVIKDGSSLVAASPVVDKAGTVKGYSVVSVSSLELEATLWPMMRDQMKGQVIIMVIALFLLVVFLHILYRTETAVRFRKSGLGALCILSFVLVMCSNAVLTVQTYATYSRQISQTNADHLGSVVGRDISRLLLVGVPLGQMSNVNQYLEKIAATYDNRVVLELVAPDGRRMGGSHASSTEVLSDSQRKIFLSDTKSEEQGALAWSVGVSVARAAWIQTVMEFCLNMLTVAVVALIFMVEMFLLFSKYCECRNTGINLKNMTQPRRSELVRPLMFMIVMAVDLSISFIPLRMAELVGKGGITRDVLLGLPISVEMGMTGFSVVLAGTWMKRKGAVPPMTTGIAFIALGYLGSMLAASPMHFVVARGFAGVGYGFCILSAQAYTVRHGQLSHMFAGVYAGSLCGSAMGGILAEQLGYGPVFLFSTFLLVCTVAVPFFLLRNDAETHHRAEKTTPMSFYAMRRLLGSPQLMGFTLLSLVPCAFLGIGFLNYFLPVYLNNAGIPQSDVGRVFMLFCLVFVYAGPPIGTMAHKGQNKRLMVCIGGVLAAGAVLCFAILPPLPASLCGAVLLGLSTCCTVPGQSEFLLQMDIAKAIGVEQTMALLNALERVGQMLGPLCIGAAITVFGVSQSVIWGGVAFLGMALLFFVYDSLVASKSARTIAEVK